MKVPYIDLIAQYTDTPEILDTIAGVLTRGQFILGPEVDAFERDFAEFCGTRFSVSVSSTSLISGALGLPSVKQRDQVDRNAWLFTENVTSE